NEKVDGIRILKGVELNILKDGTVDIADRVLEQLEFVGAGIHSYFNMDQREMTNRLLRVMENPNVDAIYHPTARQIQKRDAIHVDMERVIEVANDSGVTLD